MSEPRNRIREEAEALLKKIGWDESDTRQAAIYANMPPAQKVSMMLELRGEMIALLKRRLRKEHPELSEAELRDLFLRHIALFREKPWN